jgi:hypothetical protein
LRLLNETCFVEITVPTATFVGTVMLPISMVRVENDPKLNEQVAWAGRAALRPNAHVTIVKMRQRVRQPFNSCDVAERDFTRSTLSNLFMMESPGIASRGTAMSWEAGHADLSPLPVCHA